MTNRGVSSTSAIWPRPGPVWNGPHGIRLPTRGRTETPAVMRHAYPPARLCGHLYWCRHEFPVPAANASQATDAALRERARTSLRKAVEFYRTKVATAGGYHFAYAEDLSYGRSEMSEARRASRSPA